MLAYSNDDSDGTFWMEYKDLCRHFNKVYMCRMLDDLWTRSRSSRAGWTRPPAAAPTSSRGATTTSGSHGHAAQHEAHDQASQPDARKSSGNGRHYSNAIGFYIFKGNAPNKANDHKRRKLILAPGDEEDGGDFVFCKEPRFSKQVITEYTFEKASTCRT